MLLGEALAAASRARFPEGVQRVRGTRAKYLAGVSSAAVRRLDELLGAISSWSIHGARERRFDTLASAN